MGPDQYLYGTNEWIPIYDTQEREMLISDVMAVFKHPQAKAPMTSGRKVDYIPSRKIVIPVNRENVIKYGILDAKFADQIPDSIVLTISKDKDYLSKPELFMLDLLAGYEWDRPLHLLYMGGDLNIGIKEYLEYNGYSFKFVPIKNKTTTTEAGFVDTDELYRLMTETFRFDAVSRDDYFIDYQNMYTHLGVMSLRGMFVTSAEAFIKAGEDDRALEMIDMAADVMKHYPLETIPLGFSGNDYMVVLMIEDYYKLGQTEKARSLASELGAQLLQSAKFYIEFYDWARDEFELVGQYLYFLSDVMKQAGDTELAALLTDGLVALVDEASAALEAS